MAAINLIPTMTSNTAPSGVASASNIAGGSFAAWYAMDKSQYTFWATAAGVTNAWLQYQLSSADICNSYSVMVTNVAASPNTWTLEASDTGAFAGEEVTLDTQSGITWSASYEKKTYTMPNSTSYAYYRIHITAVNGGTQVYLSELELLQIPPNEASASVSVLATSRGNSFNRSSSALTATVSATGKRKKFDYGFQFVGEIQLSGTTQTFNFVSQIEKEAQAKIITRVNV